MKKKLLIIAIGLISFVNLSAQKEEGKSYLPKQGDVAFGINAKPVLKYAGNIFNGNTANNIDAVGGEPITNGVSGHGLSEALLPKVSIMGKYMLSDNLGLKANVALLGGTDIDRKYIKDDKQSQLNPFDESKLIDQCTTSRNGMSLMLGTEYRKGANRIQGVFGAGVVMGFVSKKTSYDYANAVTPLNQNPSAAWQDKTDLGYRVLNKKTDNSMFYGVTGSAGVEWFVAPQIALGAEVSLTFCYVNGGQQYTESEGYNAATQQVEVRTDLTSPGNNKFLYGTENLGGALYMIFYF